MAESFAYNFGYDVVDATLKAKEANDKFKLPPGFFQDPNRATTKPEVRLENGSFLPSIRT